MAKPHLAKTPASSSTPRSADPSPSTPHGQKVEIRLQPGCGIAAGGKSRDILNLGPSGGRWYQGWTYTREAWGYEVTNAKGERYEFPWTSIRYVKHV